jgi:hypothetical protein
MTIEYNYDTETSNQLRKQFKEQQLHRPMRVGRYDEGTQLTYPMTSVAGQVEATISLEIQKFVGGGFAGQVYRVKITDIQSHGDLSFPGIELGGIYAMKILIPPSGFSLFFRNVVYRIGFQGPFQLQVNPTAARAGALWQKFIRRGAKVRFGDESAVNDIHTTFVDETLGSTGEISDWVDGRTWKLEVDDKMDLLKRFLRRKKDIDPQALGSPEYRTKRKFMKDFVTLLHDMGAHEFARQYEWSTCKSQPNCLKRKDTEGDPTAGLMAVDFRAGLALLPFLPMSPGDVKLIFKGIARGSLVQFDRGNLKKLETFIHNHKEDFSDLLPMLEDLKTSEEVYRNSVPDITHNHFRLLYSKKLWSGILRAMRDGWRVRNIVDDKSHQGLSKSIILTWIFSFLGIIPFLGGLIRKIWARSDWRKHYGKGLSSWQYFKRALKGKSIEKAISWHRDGRISKEKAKQIPHSFGPYFRHVPLSILPIGLHRIFSNATYLKERLHFIFVRPIKLYFSAPFREQWLKDMVAQGQDKHILSQSDADVIHSQLKEPYIQKYLKSLAVHVCTLPITQVVSVIVSFVYVKLNPQLSNAEAMAMVAGILILFQITPVSPGSLVRGLYVVYMMIKDRSFKDYNIAVSLGFFKYIGYLAFPIQMTYRYPELARFMAGHWATEAVHIVPVFGEGGALLEHWVFRLFYNWPLTIRRRMRKISEYRETLKPRYWHTFVYILLGAALLTAGDYFYFKYTQVIPTLKNTWWIALLITIFCSAGITIASGGASRAKRFLSAAVWGIISGLLYTAASAYFVHGLTTVTGDIITAALWHIFFLAVIGTISAVITELRMKEPKATI